MAATLTPVPVSLAEALAVDTESEWQGAWQGAWENSENSYFGDFTDYGYVRKGRTLDLCGALEWEVPRKVELSNEYEETSPYSAQMLLADNAEPGSPAVLNYERSWRLPVKVEIPEEALPGMIAREPSEDEAPMTLGRLAKSMPLSLSTSRSPQSPTSLTWSSSATSQCQELPAPENFLPSKLLRWDEEGSPDVSPVGASAPFDFPPGLAPSAKSRTTKPSQGSTLHGDGSCRPCAWFWKPGGCKNGAECGHCHLCPEGEIKARKKAKQAILRLGLATPKPTGPLERHQVVMGLASVQQEAGTYASSSALTTCDSDVCDVCYSGSE